MVTDGEMEAQRGEMTAQHHSFQVVELILEPRCSATLWEGLPLSLALGISTALCGMSLSLPWLLACSEMNSLVQEILLKAHH